MSENLNPIVLEVEEVRVVNAVSPTVDLSRTENGALVTVHDYRGTQTVEIFDGSGGSVGPHPGTTDYTDLTNKPSINSVTLSGNKSLDDLGIASKDDVDSLEIVINGGTGGAQDITSTAVWATGSVNYATGGIIASTALGHADIDVEDCSHVSGFTDGGAQTDRGACFLDANGAWLWGDYNAGAGTYNWNYSFDVPQGAKTFRITCRISSEDNFTCIAIKGATEGLIDRVEALEENPGIADYTDLTNKPSINGLVLAGDRSLSELGIASEDGLNAVEAQIAGGELLVESEIALSDFSQDNFRIMASGYWAAQSNGAYYMQIPAGVLSVSIKAHASKNTMFAFLSAYSPVNGQRAPVVGNSGTPKSITAGETYTENVPDTATYIWISRQDANGYNTSPQLVKFTTRSFVNGISESVSEIEHGKSTDYSGSYYQLRVGDFKKGSVWRLLLSETTTEYAELKALTDASDTSTAETQLILYTGKEVLWSPQKDYEAIRYGVNGACKLTINDCTSLYDKMERKVFYCGASRQYTKLIDAIEAAERYMGSILYVDDGTYDLVTEFGADYFAGITTDSMPGISLKNRIHIIFSPNSYVTCHYTGDNDKVLTNFSPFNCGQYGFTLENLNLSSSRVRYAVHDERNGKTELCMSKYVNCKITHDNTQNEEWSSYSCIGGGLGSNHEVIIENCVFESIVGSGVSAHGVVYYHPSNDANNHDFAAKVTVKDNYFVNGTLELSGSRTDASIDTVVIFTNNSIPYDGANASNGIYFSGSQSYQGTHYDIKAWNNDIRQQ